MRDGKKEENEMMTAHENSRNQDLLSRWEAMRERFAAHLRSRGWSIADAEDLFGEALLKGMEKRENLANDDAAEAWFWQLANRLAIDESRRRARQPSLKPLDSVSPESLSIPAPLDSDVCCCSLHYLEKLPESAQEILKSVDCDDEPVKEFARRVDITPNSASVRLFRARKALREKLLQACNTTSAVECMTCDCDV